LSVCLLYGSAHPALGAADDLEYVVHRLRQAWPGVRIHILCCSSRKWKVPSFELA
jgi:hypothetical protein